MEFDPNKWLSVELQHGGWYVEPLDHHLYLHVARNPESGQFFLITSTSSDLDIASSIDVNGEVVASISLYELLEIARRAEGPTTQPGEGAQPGI